MSTDPHPAVAADFDGCTKPCRKAGAHTNRDGCELAPPPEPPTPVLPETFVADDGIVSTRLRSITWSEAADMLRQQQADRDARERAATDREAALYTTPAAGATTGHDDEPPIGTVLRSPGDSGMFTWVFERCHAGWYEVGRTERRDWAYVADHPHLVELVPATPLAPALESPAEPPTQVGGTDDVYQAAARAYVDEARSLGRFGWTGDAYDARVATLVERPQFRAAIDAALKHRGDQGEWEYGITGYHNGQPRHLWYRSEQEARDIITEARLGPPSPLVRRRVGPVEPVTGGPT